MKLKDLRKIQENIKIPDDLGIEVKTPEQIYLEQAKEQLKNAIVSGKEQVLMNEMVLAHIEKRIEQEQKKLKTSKQ